MIWHDCKTDPPKESGVYLLVFSYRTARGWERAWYDGKNWITDYTPIKWAEVDISEVE